MRIIREDWVVIAPNEESRLRLAFGDRPWDYRPPRWPDPDHPQQLHLELLGDDSVAAQQLALRLGAIRRPEEGGSCPAFADPAAHPFCLCTPGQ